MRNGGVTSGQRDSFTVMDADDYEETPVGQVVYRWARYTTSLASFNRLVRDSIELVGPTVRYRDLFASMTKTATGDQRRHWHDTEVHSSQIIRNDYAEVNAHILTAVWGGLESFVEDFCHAALVMDRTLLQSGNLTKVKLAPEVLLLSESEQVEIILSQAFNNVSADLQPGVGKFIAQLECIDLDGAVKAQTTEVLRNRILYAQQFRNLIVHRGSVVDKRFVKRCGSLSYIVGDKVQVSTQLLREWFSGVVAYGLLIVNSHRERHGLDPFKLPSMTQDPDLSNYVERWGQIHPNTGWFAEPVPPFEHLSI
ncbi:hypothetical protein D2E60_23995 [Mycobacteroides abscessus]|nr:hypothetical protein D2E60_23995 [Mycobacteroides abscessus]